MSKKPTPAGDKKRGELWALPRISRLRWPLVKRMFSLSRDMIVAIQAAEDNSQPSACFKPTSEAIPDMVVRLPEVCICCGGFQFESTGVLWPELIAAWELTEDEARYIDLQQGFHCTDCSSNLRTMALAHAILRIFDGAAPLSSFVHTEAFRKLRVLEINEAFTLTKFLAESPNHHVARYPDVDMTSLPFEAGRFDLVCHSDTLEHVSNPVQALSECRRVLCPKGALAYTVPIVVGRLTRSRVELALAPSYHGGPNEEASDLLVHTEYGADAWRHMSDAGFSDCRIIPFAPPAAFALVGCP
jgi:SAM-dependent methyltransferase